MTTTRTRTTRKGYTARLLTAVLAVLAVIAASLTFAASAAVADSDHNDHKITICHYVNGQGETKDGYNIIRISIRAWENGHSFPGEEQQYNHDDRDVVYNGTACPTIPTVTGYGEASAEHGLLCWNDVTYGPFTTGIVKVTLTGLQMSQERANALAKTAAELQAAKELAAMLSDFPRHDDGSCQAEPIVGYGTASYTHPAFCYLGVDQEPVIGEPVTIRLPGEWTDQATADAAAQALAEQKAMDEVNSYVDERYPGHTDGTCVPDAVVYTQSATARGTTDFCAADGVTTVTVQWSGTGTATSTASDAEALFLAQQKADAAAQADLTAKTPTDATLGACGAVTVAPVEPATVAPVEPATVEPATVAVPAAATVPLPASVPAGDGSGIPATPVWLLVLLTLGTASVIVTGTRLAMARNR